jgi:hypothetical protein
MCCKSKHYEITLEHPHSLKAFKWYQEQDTKGPWTLLLLGGEGFFDNGCYFGEMVTRNEDASCVQLHVH